MTAVRPRGSLLTMVNYVKKVEKSAANDLQSGEQVLEARVVMPAVPLDVFKGGGDPGLVTQAFEKARSSLA